MEKSIRNTNRVKSSRPSNKESSSQKPTNIPKEYFNSGHPAPTGDQASQRPYFNDKQESDSQDATNIPQEYFNSNDPTTDQASQRQYFTEVQSDPNNNNQPSQPVEPNYLDQGPQVSQPLQRELTEILTFNGTNGNEYKVFPFLTLEQAQEVESQSGVLVKKEFKVLIMLTRPTIGDFKDKDVVYNNVAKELYGLVNGEVTTILIDGENKKEINSELSDVSGDLALQMLLLKNANYFLAKGIKASGSRFTGFLGGGFFGRVYVAKLSNSDKYIAVKIIQGNERALVESSHESTLQRKLTQAVNPEASQLMPMYDAVEVKENGKLVALYTAMPLAALGSTQDLHKELNNLDNASGSFRKLLILHIAEGVLIGLYQMHKEHIYHLDFHSGNIMITGEGRVQIADFGTSEEVAENSPLLRVHQNPNGRTVGMGKIGYFPPERPRELGNKQFNPAKSDLYQVGALLWEFITGEQFPGIHSNQALNHRLLQNPPANSIADLAKQLLSDDPNNRPSVETALNHPSLCQSELHDQKLMLTVLDFLKRFVHYSQLKAQGVISEKQAGEELQAQLKQSQIGDTLSNDPLQLNPLLMTPFDNRPDIKEQLAMYLPLSASLSRKVDNQQQDTFDLYEHTQKFLSDQNKTLLLLLADGGSGKSLFMQYLTTSLLQNKVSAPNGKAYLPLYITLSSIRNPDRLLEEGLNLTPQSINKLQQSYQILILADGFDEQITWTNLYIQNQLQRYDTIENNIKHSVKLIISCRVNALPPNYGEYFIPRVAGEAYARPMQEVYVQPFQTNQIDMYVTNYIKQHQISIEEQIKHNQLPAQWLDPKYVQDQINSITGLKELMQTPLLSRLVLIALPELLKQQSSSASSQVQGSTKASGKITKAQVYEAFMRQWIITQIQKSPSRAGVELATNTTNQHIEAIIIEALEFGEKIALTIYQNKGAELNVGLTSFRFNSELGHYEQTQSRYPWFEQGRSKLWLLPLQEAQSGIYKSIHLSITEYLLASSLVRELNQSPTRTNLKLNQLALTIEEKDRPILYFLGDMASSSKVTENNLFGLINQTKTDKTQSIAGANAISILNAAHVVLVQKDFSNTSLPHADLSGALLFNTNFSKADLSKSNLKGTKLSNSNFREANLSEISLGQYPMYRLKQAINAISYSPDGRYLAISQKQEIILFNASTREEVRRFEGHTQDITSISFSKDGIKVATGSKDNTCRLWDVVSGEEQEPRVLSGHTGEISSVNFSPDGTKVATGSKDNTCRIWDVVSGEEQKPRVLSGHTGEISSVSFSPDGTKVAAGSMDNTCRLWDVASGGELGVLRGHESSIRSVSFSPDGAKVATGSVDKTCRIWNVVSGEELQVLSGHTGEIRSVSFSPDGTKVATGSWDSNCRVWDVSSGGELRLLSDHTDEITSVSFSPDGTKVATGSVDETCRIWDVVSGGELRRVLNGHTERIKSVSFSPNGTKVATGSWDKTCRIWDVVSGEELRVLSGHTEMIQSVSFSPNGTKVATGSVDKTCRIWDVASGRELLVLRGHTDGITNVSFSPDDTKLITEDNGGTKKVWLVATGLELRRDQAILVPQRAYHTLDNIIASYKDKTVTLGYISKKTSADSKINFPNYIRDISLSKDNLGNNVVLAVVMNQGVAFYHKELNAPLSDFVAISVSMIDQSLSVSGMDLFNTKGLSKSNYELLRKLGAVDSSEVLAKEQKRSKQVAPDTKSKNHKSGQVTHPRWNDKTASTQTSTIEDKKSQRSTRDKNNNNDLEQINVRRTKK